MSSRRTDAAGGSEAWTECGVCGTGLKRKNLEGHVRRAHPREYMDEYPGAPAEQGIAPCPVCWEWLSVEIEVPVRRRRLPRDRAKRAEVPELEAHVAREHPDEFGEEFPGECLLCALGLVFPFWPPTDPDDDAADFIWHNNGDDIRWGAAAAYLSDEAGVEIDEEAAREHTEEHARPRLKADGGPGGEVMFEFGRLRDRPTGVERDIMGAARSGDKYTVAELAELTGRSERGIRKRLDDAIKHGILKLVDDVRPRVYEATGDSTFPEGGPDNKADDSDPIEVPEDEATGYEYGSEVYITGYGE